MKKTSSVLYTFEDKDGYAETYQKEDFDIIVSSEKIIPKMVAVDLEGENENILVPILNPLVTSSIVTGLTPVINNRSRAAPVPVVADFITLKKPRIKPSPCVAFL
jgi:hypothetical protein